MRAIFMIPTKPPPTFTHPEDYSDGMNDFLKKCLVKDPAQRSSAKQLLTHPWVAKTCDEFERNKGCSSLLAQLVEHSMEAIQAFREKEEEEGDSGSGSDSSDDDTSDRSPAGTKSSNNTACGDDQLPPTSEDWDSGTMVMTPSSNGSGGSGDQLPPTSEDWDSGTMVMTGASKSSSSSGSGSGGGDQLPPTSDDWDSGTMVMTGDSAIRTSRGDYATGTMVMVGGREDEDESGASGTSSGSKNTTLAEARRKFEAEEEATAARVREVEDTAYGNYLKTKQQHREALAKMDGECFS